MAERIVAYERVSTARQGRSGLGLEAQRRAIETLIEAAARRPRSRDDLGERLRHGRF